MKVCKKEVKAIKYELELDKDELLDLKDILTEYCLGNLLPDKYTKTFDTVMYLVNDILEED